jgi:hypothetical protein
MKPPIPCLMAANSSKIRVFKASVSTMWRSYSPKRNPEAKLCPTWTNTLTTGWLLYECASNMRLVGSNGIELLKTKFGVGKLASRTLFLKLVAACTILD